LKCFTCGSTNVTRTEKDGNEYYLCDNKHLNERVIMDSHRIISKLLSHGLTHVSTGVLVTKGDEVLLINRRKYPFAYTIPAGHLEQDETPLDGAKRELKEETGLELNNLTLIKDYEAFYDPCKGGADYHEWHLYKAEYQYGKLIRDSEAKKIGFFKPTEIKELKLTIPTERFLKEIGII